MKTRIISAAVLLPLLLADIIFAPKICTAVLFGLMCVIAVWELLAETGLIQSKVLVVVTMVPAFSISMWSYFGASHSYLMLIILVFYIALFAIMMADQKETPFSHIALCMVAGILIPMLLCSLVRIFSGKYGRYLVFTTFIAAFLSDTGAYFAGRAFGKHKLAPAISPNKTVEGVLGGVAAAAVGMLIYCLVMHVAFKFRVNYGYALVYGVFGALGGVFGDLSFSAIKRQTGIKDYGKLIPGHGGILDRFDSMMIIGPLMEILLAFLPIAVK